MVNRSELGHQEVRNSAEAAEVQCRDYSSSGVFTNHAIADPSLLKSRTLPGQQNICSRLQGPMTNQRVIGCCTDDSPRGS